MIDMCTEFHEIKVLRELAVTFQMRFDTHNKLCMIKVLSDISMLHWYTKCGYSKCMYGVLCHHFYRMVCTIILITLGAA